MISPVIPLYFAEFSFGMVYAVLIHWLAINRYMEGHTAMSVVIGNAVTILIAYAFIRADLPVTVIFIAFACSGIPMTVSYFYRRELRKKTHKARRLGNRAARIRDEVEMDLQAIASDLTKGADLSDIVNRLHIARNYLRGM